MDYGDYYCGLYRDDYKGPLRDYHRDPFPRSLLKTRQTETLGNHPRPRHEELQSGCRADDISGVTGASPGFRV